jgi:site-specific recombinase XerD
MKRKSPGFHDLLETFSSDCTPNSAGLSANAAESCRLTFRLLLKCLCAEKSISSDDVKFETLNFDAINGFLNHVEQARGCGVATRNLRLAALTSFAAYAQNRSLDAAASANVDDRIPVKTAAVPPRTMPTLEEVAILLELPEKSTDIGICGYAMLNLMYASGARAQEACGLTVRSAQFQSDGAKFTLTGKKRKTRRINIAEPCAVLLKQYLAKRGISKQLGRHIFSSQTRGHMKASCIAELFRKYVNLAKTRHPLLFREKAYTPHSMRHTTATHMLETGVPLMAIKNFLGHSPVHTTERCASLAQATVSNYIRDWNSKWFPQTATIPEQPRGNELPKFLM